MDRKTINIIILFFVLGMGLYHMIPSEYLIGRLIYYISLYGSITGYLFHLRYNSPNNKFRKFYLYASFYSIGKMIYHLWVAITKYKYKLGLIEYEFYILGIKCELFAAIFSLIAFVTLILFLNNNE